jgi:hypothetical protein
MRNMHLTTRFLEAVGRRQVLKPLTFIWPMPGHAGGKRLSLSAFAECGRSCSIGELPRCHAILRNPPPHTLDEFQCPNPRAWDSDIA